MRSGEEIQGALRAFATDWRNYSGSERSEAQTFLNELIACYGANRRAVGARFDDAHTADGIMDLYWPDVCIIEMKAPHRAEKLPEHRKQALDYWHSSELDDLQSGSNSIRGVDGELKNLILLRRDRSPRSYYATL